MQRFSILTLAQDALAGKDDWPAFWRNRQPAAEYDVVIVGAGGHGLASAYHLARTHGIHDVAVIDKGMLGVSCAPASGLVSTYDPQGELAPLLMRSFERYAELSGALNFNIMLQRSGIMRLCHDDLEMARMRRAASLDRMTGARSRLTSAAQAKRAIRRLSPMTQSTHPLTGAMLRKDEGTVNRPALVWAYARAADSHGVHLVQNCAATGLTMRRDRVTGVETDHGPIRAKKVILAAGGATRTLALTADLALPLRSREMHTFICEPVSRVLDMAVAAPGLGLSVHQAHTGEIVIDYAAPEGSSDALSAAEQAAHAFASLFPSLDRLRLMHHWHAPRAETPDGKPIFGPAGRKGLYLSCGWGEASLSAVPGAGMLLAETVASGRAAPQMQPVEAGRFAAAGVPASVLVSA